MLFQRRGCCGLAQLFVTFGGSGGIMTTSRSVSSVPWITPEIKKKMQNATHAKAKKSGSAKLRSKFESLRR